MNTEIVFTGGARVYVPRDVAVIRSQLEDAVSRNCCFVQVSTTNGEISLNPRSIAYIAETMAH